MDPGAAVSMQQWSLVGIGYAGTQETFHFPAQVPPCEIQPGCLNKAIQVYWDFFHLSEAFYLIHQWKKFFQGWKFPVNVRGMLLRYGEVQLKNPVLNPQVDALETATPSQWGALSIKRDSHRKPSIASSLDCTTRRYYLFSSFSFSILTFPVSLGIVSLPPTLGGKYSQASFLSSCRKYQTTRPSSVTAPSGIWHLTQKDWFMFLVFSSFSGGCLILYYYWDRVGTN